MTTIEIRPTSEGASMAVRAQPGAKHEKIVGTHDGALKVAVTAPPDDGRANLALARFLAKTFGCKANQVELLQGKTDRRKVFHFRGFSVESLQAAVNTILATADS
ncbi:MAG: DUF167 domain-containing protein [Planctomycetota bacterium]|nr:DUF167 domain-containing protein [Planctomycetota bacterium]RLT11743.1 MAG: DUF167 domain-containing protein [Planctomycetota bacterium]